jgi:hypothetical protein
MNCIRDYFKLRYLCNMSHPLVPLNDKAYRTYVQNAFDRYEAARVTCVMAMLTVLFAVIMGVAMVAPEFWGATVIIVIMAFAAVIGGIFTVVSLSMYLGDDSNLVDRQTLNDVVDILKWIDARDEQALLDEVAVDSTKYTSISFVTANVPTKDMCVMTAGNVKLGSNRVFRISPQRGESEVDFDPIFGGDNPATTARITFGVSPDVADDTTTVKIKGKTVLHTVKHFHFSGNTPEMKVKVDANDSMSQVSVLGMLLVVGKLSEKGVFNHLNALDQV